MIFEIEINNKPVKVKRGETILEVLNRIGIHVPTLCSMKGFSPTGMCRMCVVEVEGRDNLIPSCSFKVEEWMKIKTHSPKVVQARKTIVELLLANHPNDCLYCERNGNCELQKHSEDLHVREKRIIGAKTEFYIDKSSASIVYEPSKCILCGRCIRVCNEQIGVSAIDFTFRGIQTSVKTALNKALNFSSCIHCGQCTMVCPTAALSEKINFSELQSFLHNSKKKMIASYSPAVAITLADEFGIKTGKDLNGIINAVLKKIGFDKVFDNSISADMQILEESHQLLGRIKESGPFPLMSSCCPSWVRYLEQARHDLLPYLSTVKSSQQLMGTIVKTFYAETMKLEPADLFVVSIMPCTSRKMEATRTDMTSKGISDIDAVITTRELIRMIRMYGIDMNTIEAEPSDMFFGTPGTAGRMINVSGGKAEMIIRSMHYLLTGKELADAKIVSLRGTKGIKEAKIKIGKLEFGVAVVNGLSNVQTLLNEIENGRKDLHYIEVMACQQGCIAGGGQPLTSKEDAVKTRSKFIYDFDEKDIYHTAHQNPRINELYSSYFGEPNLPENFNFLHTVFSKRDILL